MTRYQLRPDFPAADDGQAERIGVAMAEFISAEFAVTGYGITRTIPVGPPSSVHCCCQHVSAGTP